MKEFKLKKIKPLRTEVLLTARRYTFDELSTGSGVIRADHLEMLYPVQQIVAVSPGASRQGFHEGQFVTLNTDRFCKVQQVQDPNSLKRDMEEVYTPRKVYHFPVYEIDGGEYLLVDIHDLLFEVLEHEEVHEPELARPGDSSSRFLA